ncbi:response regulator transcription factor [Paenibacillus gansuensis]|uniref:Response regulator n=1 Tax=Paenibacillus gansuensis TaxID=306542 RepID=A0ABW5P880_9BACL
MLKLLIADDELWVRQGLTETIDWIVLGISEVKEAATGAEALRISSAFEPDIIITDIKMPGLDGLQFIEELRNTGSKAKVIFISGFSEFGYAQKAVKLGAFDYMLKPIEEPVLMDIMERCVKEIRKEQESVFQLESMNGCIRESLPLARQKFIERCLTTPVRAEEWKRGAEQLQLQLHTGNLYAASIIVHHWKAGRSNGLSDMNLLRYALGNMAEELLGEAGLQVFSCPLQMEGQPDVALVLSYAEAGPSEEEIALAAGRLVQAAGHYLNMPISIAIRSCQTEETLFGTFQKALTLCAESFYSGEGSLFISMKDETSVPALSGVTVDKPALMPVVDSTWGARVLHASATGDKDKLQELAEEVIRRLLAIQGTAETLRIRREVNYQLQGLLFTWEERQQRSVSAAESVFDKLTLMQCTLAGWKEAFLSVFLPVQRERPSAARRPIEKALQFIEENYNRSITLQDTADLLYLNPSYLSRLFHEETGETFSKYIVRVRMRRAKELLKNTPLKVYEIADRVGYKDFRHFAKTFKETEGITPAQYRDYGN